MAMSQEDILLQRFSQLPDSVRRKFKVSASIDGFVVHRGSMQIRFRRLPGEKVEVFYESAPHEEVREVVAANALVAFVVQLINRDVLFRIDPNNS